MFHKLWKNLSKPLLKNSKAAFLFPAYSLGKDSSRKKRSSVDFLKHATTEINSLLLTLRDGSSWAYFYHQHLTSTQSKA